MEKYSLQQQQEQTNKLIRVIDIDNTFQSGKFPLFRCSAQSTIGDLILYLKKQIGEQYNYYILLRNGQVFEGLEIEKIWNLLDNGKQQDIKYKKKLINIIDSNSSKQTNSVLKSQSNDKNKNQSSNLYQFPLNIRGNNFNQEYQSEQGSIKQQQNNRPPSAMHRQIQAPNIYQNANQFKQQILGNQAKQPFSNQNIQQSLIDTNSDIMQRISKLEFQVASLNKQVIEENQSPLLALQQQKIPYQNHSQKLQQELYDELSLLIEQKYIGVYQNLNEMNRFINEFKGKVDYQLKQLFQQIQLSENTQKLTQTQKQLVQSYSNKQMFQQNYQDDQSVTDTVFRTDTQVLIKLSCNHQIEKQKLELILQNSITQQKVAKCQICQDKVSTLVCRQIGLLGDQYLQIQNEKNQQQLFQVVEKRFPSKIMKCQTKNCVFYSIFDPRFGNHQNFFCPSCLTYSVQRQHNDQQQGSNKNYRN